MSFFVNILNQLFPNSSQVSGLAGLPITLGQLPPSQPFTSFTASSLSRQTSIKNALTQPDTRVTFADTETRDGRILIVENLSGDWQRTNIFEFQPNYNDSILSALELGQMLGFSPLQTRDLGQAAKEVELREGKEGLKKLFQWTVKNWKQILSGIILIGTYIEGLRNKNGNNADPTSPTPTTTDPVTGQPVPAPVITAGTSTGVQDFIQNNLLELAAVGAGIYFFTTSNSKTKRK